MARADTVTLLSLDRFATIMGANPLHFNGVQGGEIGGVSVPGTCGQPLMQWDWQTADGVARESIATAILDAETRIIQWLGYKPLPTFEVDERHSMPRLHTPELWSRSLRGSSGLGTSLKLDYGHVIAGGIERRTPISLNAAVTYADDDGDGYLETATLTAVSTLTDLNEIAAFFPGEDGDPAWEIRPAKVSVAGGVVTVKLRREQLVIPALQADFSGRGVDGGDNAAFSPSLDLFRVWHDPSQQVQFLWESPNYGSACGCSGSMSCQTCYLAAQFGCTLVRDYRLGLIASQPANWNSTTNGYEYSAYSVSRAPDRARFWYRAGYRNQKAKRPMVDMDPRWERTIAILAATLLERPICGCRNVQNITQYWRDDLALSSSDTSGSQTYRFPSKLLDNPIGTTRGALHAWRTIRGEAIGESVTL